MPAEYICILAVVTPSLLFLLWIIKRLEDEIQRLRLEPHARHGQASTTSSNQYDL
jgi:hypothetical protein